MSRKNFILIFFNICLLNSGPATAPRTYYLAASLLFGYLKPYPPTPARLHRTTPHRLPLPWRRIVFHFLDGATTNDGMMKATFKSILAV
jgi:hypothetical protein